MTRETDSSSSGPQGRGGAAYPSGTPPYGARPFPSLHPQERQQPTGTPEPGQVPPAEAAEAAPDEPKTETTLTTRIRINIPGSRPIPPVVVRTPVDENAAAAAPPVPEQPVAEAAPESGEPEPEGDKKTSDWFAPRKPVAAPGPDGGPGADSGAGTGSGATFGGGFPVPGAGDGPGTGSGTGTGSGATFGGGFSVPAPGDRAVPRLHDDPAATLGIPTPPADFFPPAPPRADDPFSGPYAEQFAEPFTDADTGSHQAPGGFPPPLGPPPAGPHDTPAAGFPSPFDTSAGTDFRSEPAPFGTEHFPPGVPRPIAEPFDPAAPNTPPGPPVPSAEDPFAVFLPMGPTTGPATGDMPVPPLGGGGFRPPEPDTGELPERSGPVGPAEAQLSGDTLVSGIPVVPPGPVSGPRPPAAAEGRPVPAPVPPQVNAPAPAAAAAPAGKKGRSKLMLLCVAAGFVAVLAYGAGLLMNHADVPKGTTVLGVDIGNMNQDVAVKTLNQTLDQRKATADLDLTIGGRKQTLKASIAGLSVDTDATVRKVAHSDYNPVSVIGSLFGGSRTADPVIVVDEDKLKAALTSVAGKSSAGSDGMVRFTDGKAVAVPGKPSQSFDVDAAANQVSAAYRTRAETGVNQPVALKVTTVPPKVTQAELDKAVNGFGKTAMSGPATVTAGGIHAISFHNSLSQFLTMVATPDGKLAPHIDLNVLKSLYGSTYDGVLLERGNGSKTAVTPQDIATALIQALGAPNLADRTVMLPNVAK